MYQILASNFKVGGVKVVFHCWVYLYYIASLATDIEVKYPVTIQVGWTGHQAKYVRSILQDEKTVMIHINPTRTNGIFHKVL